MHLIFFFLYFFLSFVFNSAFLFILISSNLNQYIIIIIVLLYIIIFYDFYLIELNRFEILNFSSFLLFILDNVNYLKFYYLPGNYVSFINFFDLLNSVLFLIF
jgi:hypothetical protein